MNGVRLGVQVITGAILAVVLIIFLNGGEACSSVNEVFECCGGARMTGMGKVGIALVWGADSLCLNPAGLAGTEEVQLGSTSSSRFDTLDYFKVRAISPGFGVSYLQLDSGLLEKRDRYGRIQGSFRYLARGVVFGWAKKWGSVAWGVGGRMYFEDNDGLQLGFSLSPSFLYALDDFRFGAIFVNVLNWSEIEGGIRFGFWPVDFLLGLGYENSIVSIGLDVKSTIDRRGIEPSVIRMGVEVRWWKPVTLRFGVNGELESSIGVGWKKGNFSLDYAYSVHRDLPHSHRISFGFSWPGWGRHFSSLVSSWAGLFSDSDD